MARARVRRKRKKRVRYSKAYEIKKARKKVKSARSDLKGAYRIVRKVKGEPPVVGTLGEAMGYAAKASTQLKRDP